MDYELLFAFVAVLIGGFGLFFFIKDDGIWSKIIGALLVMIGVLVGIFFGGMS